MDAARITQRTRMNGALCVASRGRKARRKYHRQQETSSRCRGGCQAFQICVSELPCRLHRDASSLPN